MKVKICGLKTIQNSRAACEAGADLLGFNFYRPSSRYIEIEACREIVKEIKTNFPEIYCVGVFVNHLPSQIKRIMTETGLDLAQLSGDEICLDLELLGSSAFKALRPDSLPQAMADINSIPIRTAPPAFLLDHHQKGAYGGTGKTGNWKLAAEIAKKYPILLAGGLNPKNIISAIEEVQPWGVDVASGVEIEPGFKDPEKIKTFIQKARSVNPRLIKKNGDNYGTR